MSGNDPSTDATDTVPTSRAGPADVGDGGVDEMSWSIGTGLDGKSVVVTGAAGGIGRAVAAAFAAASARVCAVDVDGAAVREGVEERGAAPPAGGGGKGGVRAGTPRSSSTFGPSRATTVC